MAKRLLLQIVREMPEELLIARVKQAEAYVIMEHFTCMVEIFPAML